MFYKPILDLESFSSFLLFIKYQKASFSSSRHGQQLLEIVSEELYQARDLRAEQAQKA